MCFRDEDCAPDPTRRVLIVGSIGLAVGGMMPAFAQTETSAASPPPPTRVLDNPGAVHGPVTFTHNGQPTIGGFLARPAREGTFPAVIVVAGNRISEEYIPNTCAALALAGFVGLAPDIFHIVPESAQTLDELRAASANHSVDDVFQDLVAGLDYLRAQPFVRRGGIGALGFCFGGRLAMILGARSREVDAVVAYHPGPTSAEEIAGLDVPVQIHYGTADRAVPFDAIQSVQRTLQAQRTPVELHLYEGADHGFLAYTRPPRYDPVAGALSWERSIAFLRRTLR